MKFQKRAEVKKTKTPSAAELVGYEFSQLPGFNPERDIPAEIRKEWQKHLSFWIEHNQFEDIFYYLILFPQDKDKVEFQTPSFDGTDSIIGRASAALVWPDHAQELLDITLAKLKKDIEEDIFNFVGRMKLIVFLKLLLPQINQETSFLDVQWSRAQAELHDPYGPTYPDKKLECFAWARLAFPEKVSPEVFTAKEWEQAKSELRVMLRATTRSGNLSDRAFEFFILSAEDVSVLPDKGVVVTINNDSKIQRQPSPLPERPST